MWILRCGGAVVPPHVEPSWLNLTRNIHSVVPPKGRTFYDEQLRLEREESCERNGIEGKFGEGKRRDSLGLLKKRLQETNDTHGNLGR